MHLKLIQSIRVNSTQHRPPAVVDTNDIGISDAEAEVLVRSGVASIVEPEPDADAEAAAAKEAAEAEAKAAAEAKPTAKKR